MNIIKSNCAFCGLYVERKKQTKIVITHFCNNKCKSEYQKLQKPVSKEWLIEHYINKKLTCPDIAILVNRDAKTVWNWIKSFKIETRPRGYDTSLLLKDGSAFRGKTHSDKTKEKLRNDRKISPNLPHLIGGEHWLKNKPSSCHPNYKGGLTPDRQSVYASQEWVNAVKQVWKRDKAICQKCGKNHNDEVNRGNFHIHHIVSFMIKELRTDVNNLVLLCKDCHKFVHSKKNINKEFIGE